jgi:hypothetical protein
MTGGLYWDDWGIVSHTPELRTHLPIGPVEFRVTGRYYQQQAASFWSDDGIKPFYSPDPKTGSAGGLNCYTCVLSQSSDPRARFYTGDPKLGDYTSTYLELRVQLRLSFLRRLEKLPARTWLADGLIDVSYGHYWNGGYAHTAFGDAHTAGLAFSFPL